MGCQKSVFTFLVVSMLSSTPAYALFISQDFIYQGATSVGGITVDTDTGLEWIDPWLPIVNGGAAGLGTLNAYNDVKAELVVGGDFEGFRFASLNEIETLFYSSAGIDPLISQGLSTPTQSDISAIGNLLSFFDSTLGVEYGPGESDLILDAVFENEITGDPMAAVFSSITESGQYTEGSLEFYSNIDLAVNTNPYGFWLVRDAPKAVSEPSTILFFTLFGLAAVRFRKAS